MTIRAGQPRTATSTFTQLLCSVLRATDLHVFMYVHGYSRGKHGCGCNVELLSLKRVVGPSLVAINNATADAKELC